MLRASLVVGPRHDECEPSMRCSLAIYMSAAYMINHQYTDKYLSSGAIQAAMFNSRHRQRTSEILAPPVTKAAGTRSRTHGPCFPLPIPIPTLRV